MQEQKENVIERVTSPEELDRRLVVVSSKGWIALLLTCLIILGAIAWAFFGEIPTTLRTEVIYLNQEGYDLVHSPVEGVVKEVFVDIGDSVAEGETLLVVEKEEGKQWKAGSGYQGKVIELFSPVGQSVSQGEPIVVIQKGKGDFAFFAFLPIERGQQVKEGMAVNIQPAGIDVQEYGSIEALVSEISPYVATYSDLYELLGNKTLIPYFTHHQPVLIVTISPEKDLNTVSGLKWTSGYGPPQKIHPQTVGSALFVLKTRRPISYVIPLWTFKRLSG